MSNIMQSNSLAHSAGQSIPDPMPWDGESLFRSAIESMQEGFVLQDKTGAIRLCNLRAQQILGMTADQMMGKTAMDPHWRSIREDGSDYPGELHPTIRSLRHGEILQNVIMGVHKPNGELCWTSVNTSPLFCAGDPEPAGVVATFTDITERKREAEERDRLAAIVDSSADAIMSVTLDGLITSWNDGAERLYGYAASEIIGQHQSLLLPPGEPSTYEKVLKSVICDGPVENIDVVRMRRDGALIHIASTVSVIKNALGQPIGASAIVRDITERKRADQIIKEYAVALEAKMIELEAANAKLHTLASTDGLTGLKNHRAFQERLADETQTARRYGTPLAIVMLDVDHFKPYNDAFGHPAGDEVLKQVAAILQQQVRECDLAARYGGEEFMIVLPQTGSAGAMAFAERCRVAIEDTCWFNRPVTASFGVAVLNYPIQTAADLISIADEALYEAKATGRNRVIQLQMPLAA